MSEGYNPLKDIQKYQKDKKWKTNAKRQKISSRRQGSKPSTSRPKSSASGNYAKRASSHTVHIIWLILKIYKEERAFSCLNMLLGVFHILFRLSFLFLHSSLTNIIANKEFIVPFDELLHHRHLLECVKNEWASLLWTL